MNDENMEYMKKLTLQMWIEAYEWLVVKMNEEQIPSFNQNELIQIIRGMRIQMAKDFPDDSES